MNYCINCSAALEEHGNNICGNCKHNQSDQVIKKITSAQEMAMAAVSFNKTIGRSYIDNLIESYEKEISDEVRDKISSAFLLSNLAIIHILYLEHYKKNKIFDQIYKSLSTVTEHNLTNIFGEEGLEASTNYLSSTINDYLEILKDENYLLNLSMVLQRQVELLIIKIENEYFPKGKVPYPSIHITMNYTLQFTNFMRSFQTVLNKWDIE